MINIACPSNKKIYVTGPIYDQLDQLKLFISEQSRDTLFIINGGICYPNNDINIRIDELIELQKKYDIKFIMGDKEYKHLLKKRQDLEFDFYHSWLESQAKACRITFTNQSKITIINGNMPELIENKREHVLCFNFQNDWHLTYNGRLGYVISNYPSCKDNIILYDFSCSIGTKYQDKMLIVQEINYKGLGETFLLKDGNKKSL